jgi:hypothetical protein
MTDDDGRWDVFVSYTEKDLRWAEWAAWQLEAAGWRVRFQAWDFVAGTNWVHLMQESLRGSERLLALLSEKYLRSAYGTAEWEAVWACDPLGQQRRLLTARVEDCDRPGLLGQVVGIDLYGVPEDQARERLLSAVRAATAGRTRPSTPPPFPGDTRPQSSKSS